MYSIHGVTFHEHAGTVIPAPVSDLQFQRAAEPWTRREVQIIHHHKATHFIPDHSIASIPGVTLLELYGSI